MSVYLVIGPNHWYQMDPAWWRCKPDRPGAMGSPIDIITDDVVSNPDFVVLLTGARGSVSGVLVNNGMCVL